MENVASKENKFKSYLSRDDKFEIHVLSAKMLQCNLKMGCKLVLGNVHTLAKYMGQYASFLETSLH